MLETEADRPQIRHPPGGLSASGGYPRIYPPRGYIRQTAPPADIPAKVGGYIRLKLRYVHAFFVLLQKPNAVYVNLLENIQHCHKNYTWHWYIARYS